MAGSNDAGVSRVMSLRISSSVYPTASLAAILAIGNPVALDASAEERETRGFSSMTTSRPSAGFTANWLLLPPVSTPIPRVHAAGVFQLVGVVGDRAAGAAEGERRPDDHRVTDLPDDLARFLERADLAGLRQGQPDPLHGHLELLAVLGLLDRGQLGPDQLDAEAVEHPVLGQRDGEVQARLAAQRRQERLRTLALDDLGQELGRQRLDVGAVGRVGI